MELNSPFDEKDNELVDVPPESEDVRFSMAQRPATKHESCGVNIKEFCIESSFKAVTYGFRNKPLLLKILWAGIVVLLIAGFCAVTLQGIILLVKEPTATSIKLVREKSVDFPAVTICNLNIINHTSLSALSIPGYDVPNKLNDLLTAARSTPPNEPECRNLVAEAMAVNPTFDVNFGGLTTFARFYPNNLILECSYIGEDCTNSFTPVNTVEGVCFTFNGPNSTTRRKASGTGVRQGLRLLLSGNIQTISQSIERDVGYKIVIHNQDEPPRPESNGIAVALNSATYIGMRTVKSIDNTQYYSGRECKDATSRYSNGNMSLRDYPAYSPDLCLYDCFYSTIADQCGCVERDLYTPVSRPYTQMENCSLTDLCCEIIQFDTFSQACKCPPKCETVDRTLTISSSTMNEPQLVGVNIYYETLVTEQQETLDSYTPWSLISDIGGNTGLLLGFTLLALAEFLMFVIDALVACCCKKRGMSEGFQSHRIN